MRNRFRIFGLLLLTVSAQSAAQTESGIWDVPRTGGDAITEPSPEATAMRRFQDYPVSHATGTADISIPLINLQNGSFGISLGLRYHTGGIKKTDIATAVGLGWSLTGLGSISRQINGFPDEWRGYGNSNDVSFDLRTTSGIDPDYLRAVLEAKKDVEYDCYNYNIDGHSGSFYIVDGEVVEYPPSDLVITFMRANADNSGEITKFEIYSPEGMVYTFEEKEYIVSKSYSTTISIPLINRDYTAVSQWNLTKIESIYDRDVITVSYTPRQEWTRISDKTLTGYGFNYDLSDSSLRASESQSNGPNLDERTTFRNHSMPSCISTSTGSIEFTSHSFSADSYIDTPADFISGLKLKDVAGNVIRTVAIDNSTTFRDGRHKLSGVDILNQGILVDSYRFFYNDKTAELGYDIFGYPNGKGSESGYNHSVITYRKELSSFRQSDPNFIADNCLNEIRTITGLKTSIKYEPATINIIPAYEESVFNGNIIVGPRIKSIETIDTVSGRIRNRSYEYLNTVSDIPLDGLIFDDFRAQSGIHRFYPRQYSNYSMGVTFLPSASLRGTPVENAQLYYGRVIEKITGTDIEYPVVTEYEYDLSGIKCGLMLLGQSITDEQCTFGNNPENAKSLGSLQNCIGGLSAYERDLVRPVSTRGYISHAIGSSPLLSRKIEKEWTDAGYRINSTEEHFYSKTDMRRFVCALYCESVVFRYDNITSPTLNITDYKDVNYFCNEMLSYRTVCDSTIKTTYYPDGNNRSVKTVYINTANSGKGGAFPGFYSTDVRAASGVAFTPFGVVVSCGDESISTYTARTENVDTEQSFNAWMAGLRKLPVLEKWVTRTPTGNDSVLRQTNYEMFGVKSFIRPSSVWVGSAERYAGDRTKISEQIYTSYDARGRIAAMKDASGCDIEAEWDGNYNLLNMMKLPAASLTTFYTHIPLVGCTSITSPSGKKRQFTYEAGRQISEKNTAGLPIASYSYSLFGEQGNNGHNLITSTFYDDSGNAVESALYDGFGMAIRKLSTVAGGSQTIMTTDYDALDRPVRQFLPVPASAIDDTPDATAIYNDPYPYKNVNYRNIVSDKPLSVISEGSLMQDHPTTTEYLCNSTANPMLRCHRYRLAPYADEETVISDAYYPAGELDVARNTDQDGHISLVFTDWRGFRILERRVLDTSSYVDTYFLYDPTGRLRVVIQPKGSVLMTATSGSWDNSSDPLSKYAFIYRYDRRGNCIHSLVPGGGPVEMRYDVYNRLAFRTTAALKAEGRTEFNLYDHIGRSVVSGIVDCDIPETDSVFNMTATYSVSADGIDATGYEIQDSGLAALLGDATASVANYYDDYSVTERSGFSSLPLDSLSLQCAAGLLTATRQAIYSGSYGEDVVADEYQYSIFAYDDEERQVAAVSSAEKEALTLKKTKYSRRGYIDRTTEYVIFPDTVYTLFLANTHDALGNIIKSEASLNPGEVAYFNPGQSKIDYSYDALGRMACMTLLSPAHNYCDYSYDIHGRLKSITSPIFSQGLNYEDCDAPKYNGSISSESYGYECDAYTGKAWCTDNVVYSYDNMNRLVSSVSSDGYDSSFDYDLNSSPVGIVRKGLMSDGVSVDIVDDLSLNYDGNRLTEVVDAADAVNIESSLDFVGNSDETMCLYDASGRMTSYPGTSGLAIKYAPNDMPVSMSSDRGNITCRYLYDGTKLSSTVTTMLPGFTKRKRSTQTYDIGSFRFYENKGNPGRHLERISLPWGYLDDELESHIYIKDYQDNIRAVFNQSNNTVVQQTDYYPYGLPKATSFGAEVNPFKYGGKELNTNLSLTFYDFEARMLLTELCMFQRPDPMAGDYTWLNPYVYCGGDPINRVDKDGKLIIFVNGMHSGDGGSAEYWSGIDNIIMNDLNDTNVLYYDGSNGGLDGLPENLNCKNREVDGYVDGLFDAEDIINGLDEGEKIKFITHSMGASYTKGFISGMKSYGEKNNINVSDLIDFELDIAPFQADKQVVQDDVPTFTLQHSSDMVAIPYKVDNATNNIVITQPSPGLIDINSHKIGSFSSDLDDMIKIIFKKLN